jgi:peptidoglycan/xylan/chitin deacetylase (PgdA/CDA1 family)
MSAAHYYSRLAPFEQSFLTGRPILTYHHVGPRPHGARLKGLYVSPRLFNRQMGELEVAGFSTPSFDRVLENGPNLHRQVFITFDDGFRDVLEHALPVLGKRGFQGMLFLVSGLIGRTNEWQQRAGDVVEPLMRESEVRAWIAAGQRIGGHTRTHPRLTQLARDQAREEIVGGKKELEDRFGVAVEHFCYPYGDWNAEVRGLVECAGYRSACTTDTGFNAGTVLPFQLQRVTARYPSRSLRAIWQRWRGR